jgi:hypothetical protein
MVRRMLVLRRRLAAVVATFLLATPATALGQSAGDEQYEDPFAGDDQGQTQAPEATATPAPAEPAPAEPATPAPAPEPASTPAPAPQPGAAPAELPRTGLDAAPVLALGAVLLAGGVVLRLRVRGRG